MRLFLFLAIACFVVALVCAAVPTTVFSLAAVGWIAAGLLSYVLDLVVGGVSLPAAHQ